MITKYSLYGKHQFDQTVVNIINYYDHLDDTGQTIGEKNIYKSLQ